MNNREFAQKDKPFQDACSRAKVQPTTRQASKWRNEKGLAWKVANGKVRID